MERRSTGGIGHVYSGFHFQQRLNRHQMALLTRAEKRRVPGQIHPVHGRAETNEQIHGGGLASKRRHVQSGAAGLVCGNDVTSAGTDANVFITLYVY